MSLETSPLVLAAQEYLGNEIKAAKVLEYFEFISSIPHISGYEAQLASKLIEWANENKLAARMDEAGNVWIVRAPDVTCEEAQEIILQGHLDMVADKLDDNDFDFIKSGIPLEVTTDGYIKSKANTSLGADNGIGVALAMAILTDKTIKTGKIKTACLMIGITLTLFYNLPFELINIRVSDVFLIIATVLNNI